MSPRSRRKPSPIPRLQDGKLISRPRYAAAKRVILSRTQLQDDIRTHALASLFAGTVATTACAPADVLKSRIQSAAKGSSVGVLLSRCAA